MLYYLKLSKICYNSILNFLFEKYFENEYRKVISVIMFVLFKDFILKYE